MADKDLTAEAGKLQKKFEDHSKELQSQDKQLDKLSSLLKKARQAAKRLDERFK